MNSLCTIIAPDVQKELDACRRQCVRHISRNQTSTIGFFASFTTEETKVTWKTFQITPEIHLTFTLKGCKLPYILAQNLKRALQAQENVLKAFFAKEFRDND